MDEQMRNCQQEGRSAETITSQPQGMGSIANLNKFIDMSGMGCSGQFDFISCLEFMGLTELLVTNVLELYSSDSA